MDALSKLIDGLPPDVVKTGLATMQNLKGVIQNLATDKSATAELATQVTTMAGGLADRADRATNIAGDLKDRATNIAGDLKDRKDLKDRAVTMAGGLADRAVTMAGDLKDVVTTMAGGLEDQTGGRVRPPIVSRSLRNILESQLMFPLPVMDGVQRVDPVIEVDHPLYDYYDGRNWGEDAGDGSGINRIIVLPQSIGVAHAGLFKAHDPAKLRVAVSKALRGWNDIVIAADAGDKSDTPEAVQAKLHEFVRAVAVEHCRLTVTSSFDYTVADEPNTFADVFLCAKATPYCPAGHVAADATAAKSHQRSSAAYKRLEAKYRSQAPDVGFNGHSNTADALFDAMRLYWAYRNIDTVFESADEYYFLQRLVFVTRMVFVAKLLLAASAEAQADQLMSWIYMDNLRYAMVDPGSDSEALDDMFKDNVRSSQEIKRGSVELQSIKSTVVTAQDNLQSLASSDRLVKAQRRNALIIFWVFVALLLLQLACLFAASAMKSPMTAYVVIAGSSALVLGLELTRTVKSLLYF
jgi:hypothetical protein